MAGAGGEAEAAGGKDRSNRADDNEEHKAAAHRSKEEEEETEAAMTAFLECWLRHRKEDAARKKKEEEEDAARARKRKEDEEDAARKKKKEEEEEQADAAPKKKKKKEEEEEQADAAPKTKKKEEEEQADAAPKTKKKEEEEQADAAPKTKKQDNKKDGKEESRRWKTNRESIKKDLQDLENKAKDEVDNMRQWLMLLATLAVSITYAAGLNPPGGMWQDNKDGHIAGTPVLQTNDRSRYLTFYYSNALSFMTSLVIVALLLKQKNKLQLHVQQSESGPEDHHDGKVWHHHDGKLLVFVTLFDFVCLGVAYLAGTTNGVLLSIPLIVVAIAAFIYFAYGILILVCLGALAALMWCLSALIFSSCFAAMATGCLFQNWCKDKAQENDDAKRGPERVDVV